MIHVMRMPGVNANEDSAMLVRWIVDEGAPVKKGQLVCEIETTKSAVEVEAEADGFLVPLAPAGASQSVGVPIAVIKASLDLDHAAALAGEAGAGKSEAEKRWTKKAAIVARRLGIDIDALAKSKPGVTLTEADVLAAQSGAPQPSPAAATAAPVPVSLAPQPATAPRLAFGQHFERILLIGGASGAGALAVEAILRTSHQRPGGIIDTNPKTHGQIIHGVPVLGDRTSIPALWKDGQFDGAIILFTDDIDDRTELFNSLVAAGVRMTNVIDPSVQIRTDVKMGVGNAIMSNGFIAHSVEIGNNNFFASHNVIEHHSKVGDHNAFGPRCTACGRVTIGNSIRFGMHVGIEPYLTIGDRCIIASGTTLTSSVPANTIVKARSTNEFRAR
ncbi:biotin/lipoyl-containing protein [Hyphomicrobium sp. LHD-15]|uniref:biotin/lipoyl-containing protein n=1 Tax=Hyphomicrobium sp. LHD-15 TaxID=3072142 RepID=UPI00280C6DD2|nr:biotin/lipoyl-containing protein [Hyphomicrobium sp. LHD-15]MDQ8698797.1 biotin/lipoyl-containing protein [Hyphomicrobium sp. LHD-15]